MRTTVPFQLARGSAVGLWADPLVVVFYEIAMVAVGLWAAVIAPLAAATPRRG